MSKVLTYTTDFNLKVELEDKCYVSGTSYAFIVPDDFDFDSEIDRWGAKMVREVRWANKYSSGTRTVIDMLFEEWLANEYQEVELIEASDDYDNH
jgi:hypothetical protein